MLVHVQQLGSPVSIHLCRLIPGIFCLGENFNFKHATSSMSPDKFQFNKIFSFLPQERHSKDNVQQAILNVFPSFALDDVPMCFESLELPTAMFLEGSQQ